MPEVFRASDTRLLPLCVSLEGCFSATAALHLEVLTCEPVAAAISPGHRQSQAFLGLTD